MMKLVVSMLGVVVALLSPLGVDAELPPPVCYYKTQKCCFTYGSCGYEKKVIEKRVDCPYQKCEQKCKNECYPVPKCSYKQVEDGQDCKQVSDGYYGYKEVCTPKYKQEKYCYDEEKCEYKCAPYCYTVPAYCTKYYTYQYPKYCPTPYCDKLLVTEGSDVTPSLYVSPTGEYLGEENGPRHDVAGDAGADATPHPDAPAPHTPPAEAR